MSYTSDSPLWATEDDREVVSNDDRQESAPMEFSIMDPKFFDVKYVEQPEPEINEGEIEIIEEPANPMQKLEKLSIKQDIANLYMRLLSAVPTNGPMAGHHQQGENGEEMGEGTMDMEMEVDDNAEVDGANLINSTYVHEVRKLMDNDVIDDEEKKHFFTHEVVVPTGMSVPQLRARNAVPSYHFDDFDLDPFQKAAIQVVENEQSLLVAAHTSAGKTAIAQYAIAEALRNHECVIYTSPIKALSNQKYRELEEKFDGRDVGLMTGDVTLNPRAPVQVMTTEILRNMLYRKSEFFSQVAWVIFDEVHYMNNEERGVVWEESIILLPSHIRHLYLSATIPNALQFAGWICSLKRAPVHVVSTVVRPVPIVHYVLPVGTEKMFEVVARSGYFREPSYAQAVQAMQMGLEKEKREKKRTIKEAWVIHATRTLRERGLQPCIAFTFSRAECEHYAVAIKDMDMTDGDEKATVRGIIENATDRLTDDDRKLSQLQNLMPLLVRGIAVHHSGLLPVVKETVELLFAHGLIKMLFATETFAMGLNIPARSVLFTSARKFDGKRNRLLTASEYAQMSGRAGRRDSHALPVGVSVLMLDEQIKTSELHGIVKGSLDPLTSRFRLSYGMLLNLLSIREMRPEQMMELSLRKYQSVMEVPQLSRAIAEKEAALSSLTSSVSPQVAASLEEYLTMENGIKLLTKAAKKLYMDLRYLVPFFNVGRLLKIKLGDLDFGWGVLLKFERKTVPDTRDYMYILQVLLHVDAASAREFNSTGVIKPASWEGPSTWEVVPMTANCVDEIAVARFRVYKEMRRQDMKEKLGGIVEAFVRERMDGAPTLLDPINDMKVRHEALEEALSKMRSFQREMQVHPLETMRRGSREERERFVDMRKEYEERAAAEQELKQLRHELRKKKADIRTGTELFRRKEVLLKLGYIDDDDCLKKKGRIASCIATGDELLLTELLVSGELEKVGADGDLAALLSCFVCDESSGTKMRSDLTELHKLVQKFARKIATHVNRTGQELVEGEYMDQFKSSMMEVTRQWIKGVGFAQLLKGTDLYEGSIIRSLRRLEELLKEMSAAAAEAGNPDLQYRFDTIRTTIRRDIVFSSSLYL